MQSQRWLFQSESTVFPTQLSIILKNKNNKTGFPFWVAGFPGTIVWFGKWLTDYFED